MGSIVHAAVRLSKRVSEIAACSRGEAEQYIEGGWVRVDGAVICAPGFKVSKETVELDAQASL
ncbi:MAG: S4 domain-containing protein, partial [Burkholderiaceae bacterium]